MSGAWFSRLAATALLALLWAGQAQAGLKRLSPFPAAGIEATLLSLDDRPAVLTGRRIFILRDQRGWTPLAGRLSASRVGAAAARGRTAIIDRSGKPVRQVEIVSLVGDTVVVRATRPLPVALDAVQAAWESDTLLIAGTGIDRRVRLFSLQLGGWSTEPAWPDGPIASLAAQNRVRVVTLANERLWRWTATTGWRRGTTAPSAVVPGSGAAVEQVVAQCWHNSLLRTCILLPPALP